jgi:undecaprenyl-diphosphatase
MAISINLNNFAVLLRKSSNYPWMLHWAILAPLLCTVSITGILHGFWGEEPRIWYESLRMAYPDITAALKVIGRHFVSPLYVVYCIVLAYSVAVKDWDKVIFVFRFIIIALVYALLVTKLLKAGLGMPRPGHPLPLHPFSFLHSYSSFPSGHTVSVITAALPLALWAGSKKVYIPLSLLIAAVGVSRLWLGVHHPVDVLGGIVVGSVATRFIMPPHYSLAGEIRYIHTKKRSL